MTTKRAQKEVAGRLCIVTTRYRGLYYALVKATDAEIVATKAASVDCCRHIAYWKGPRGGITSLAATGPADGSRIGMPVDGGLITGIANIWPVTEVAAAAFDKVQS